ncbi:hypothetical protein Nepgr_002182 [Nepenthes gracilis]|uniref:Uncharacterized protein n=1 Tax=Nepenthes gracilis TaxID=150966 RepID=A0AAD3P6H5_NEPGR|nr:hypothetical protein Nepgr_002182 [Nepenthes gracilis]
MSNKVAVHQLHPHLGRNPIFVFSLARAFGYGGGLQRAEISLIMAGLSYLRQSFLELHWMSLLHCFKTGRSVYA